jgi:uncharacterized membrane protein
VTHKPSVLVLFAVCLYVALFSLMQFRLYDAFRMGLRDLGFFQQALESALGGKPFLIRQGYTGDTSVSHLFHNAWDERTLFSEHLYLCVPLLLPLYALFREPYILFVLNAVGVGLAALPLYWLAWRRLQSGWLAAAVACAFLLHPAVQVATLGDYIYGMHPDDFAPLFLFSALCFAAQRKARGFWLMSLLGLALVESVAPTVAAIGLYAALTQREWRRHGVTQAIVAVLYFFAATLVLIPLAGGGRSPYYFAAFQTLLAAAANPALLQPIGQAVFDLATALLVPLAGLPLLGGPLWLIALPQLLSGIAAQTVGYPIPLEYGSWHVWPYVLAASLALIRALALLQRLHSRVVLGGALLLLVVGAIAGMLLFGPYPFSRNVWPPAYDVDEAKQAFVAQARSTIPADAGLSVEFFLGSHFAGRPNVYWFPVNWRSTPYVLVDSGAWAWWSEDDGHALAKLQRSAYVEPLNRFANVFLFRHQPMPPIQQPLAERFANGMELTGYTAGPPTLSAGAPVTLTLFWRASAPVPLDLTVFVHVADSAGKVIAQRDSQPDNGAYPTSEWPSGETIMDRRVIRLPADAAPGSYAFELGLYDVATGKRVQTLAGTDQLRVGSFLLQP